MTKKKNSLEYVAPSDLEKQENLDIKRLINFIPVVKTNFLLDPRPEASFLELMNWAKENFSQHLSDRDNINLFIHNRIVIDGQFLSYCEENKVKITCLYKDSIISWRTENNFEKFFVQGIFLIQGNGFEFIHCALFHKGNQNEDEISFFILVADKNYESYVNFRNNFDDWVLKRDRSNLHIRVVDGEDIPYTKDNTWEELFLPNNIKDEIKLLVENFLASKDFYMEKKIPWKRGILLYGKPGNGKTSIIKTIISMYNFKPVTIVPGANDESIREAFAYAEEQSPSLLYFEDLDSLLERGIDASTFLNLMDGISAKNGLLVIATANEVKKLKSNITDRPSRFDRKFEIPLPNQEMAYIYIKRWFGNLINIKKCKELAKYAVKYEFSYAYLKELYISVMFEALSNNRQTPTDKDVNIALARLVKDKNILNNYKTINTDKYFK